MSISDDEELIHEFRVAFKKSRAVIRLTGNLKIPSSLKELYTDAGKVRELQLLKKQLLTSAIANRLPHFNSRIDREVKQAVNLLKEKAADDYKNDLSELINRSPEKLSGKQIQKFIDKQYASLHQAIQLPYKKDEDIHEVRKIIKDLTYALHALEQMKEAEFYLSSKQKQTLHHISFELGIFQDWCTVLSYLSLTKLRTLPDDEKEVLKKTRAKFLKTKQEAKAIILHQLNEFSPLLSNFN